MYNFPEYKEADRKQIIDFMRAHPFVTIIGTRANGRAELSQVPVLIEERDGQLILRAHIARKSDHHQALEENPAALVLFTGAHTYVSGTWYTGNPHQASTWNYISIHARGNVQWMDEENLRAMLRQLTLHFENGNTRATTVYDNLPSDYVDKNVKGIVGFEMVVKELENVYKLSQNRDEQSYDNVVKELKQRDGGAREIGTIMENRKSTVFPS